MKLALRYVSIGLMLTAVAGCSLFPNYRLTYQQAELGEPLALPDGLTINADYQLYTLPDDGALLADDQKGKLNLKPPEQLDSIFEQQRLLEENQSEPMPVVKQVNSVMSNDGNGYPMIMIDTRFAWAWEYIDQALEASRIKVGDRDRAAGVYYIKLPKNIDSKQTAAEIKLSHTTNGVQVVALNKKGKELLNKEQSRLLLARIYAEL